ncbi:sulfite exporter TauE/SafE family protein [Pedobacter aquatilis]|uniref:sulfite exporter TauE/SafE family protein n=1 Tax=Pedobacter aquatilis TaxID=351343 RepID=UPI0025B2B65A|nr:sulfite exporter TauE/SafE family protein [Pedobacter aquatilis]MDN3586026.1 sulfite exporter TauE/SafE family protein [Pedobacter aquatilis]
MGLFGSLHCAVMCGPIMLSLPMQRRSLFEGGLSLLLYQSGRILTYTVLGFIAGWIGQTFSIIANQKILSISLGMMLVLMPIIQFSAKYGKVLSKVQLAFVNPMSKLTSKVFKLPFWEFFAGALNGIIPCGMVYLAFATAINSANATGGAEFMFLFGLGTAPLLIMISLGGIYLKRYIRFNTNRLIPWFMLFVGMLLILRACELGIPFISPYTNTHFSKGAICK